MGAREHYDLDALEEDGWGRRDRGPLPSMDHTGGWKASQYDPRLGREIVRRVLCGETMRAIAADEEMPSYPTLFQWLRVHADFRWRYQAARRRRAADERLAPGAPSMQSNSVPKTLFSGARRV
ncbi:hypothetical protein [Phenylobacterium sp.]|uniref:terminase small subunit-like protein n=1 Tax=Phenylobacterium sp. TaxID=1871053 RepID=UPI002C79DF92|nr:hypothetical protein [Phenylobacterium sp.]HVI31337.1 hypothetical protein [Phenylobacterium sp.]